jgi:predicted amidohydrolase
MKYHFFPHYMRVFQLKIYWNNFFMFLFYFWQHIEIIKNHLKRHQFDAFLPENHFEKGVGTKKKTHTHVSNCISNFKISFCTSGVVKYALMFMNLRKLLLNTANCLCGKKCFYSFKTLSLHVTVEHHWILLKRSIIQ